MATLRELKTRIGSVSSSEKITGAMKMISSAKMHKNEQALRKLTPFQRQIRSIMGHLLETDATFSSPLIEKRQEVKRIAIVVYGSDDGLCGGYNINIFKYLLTQVNRLQAEYPGAHIEVYSVGKKMAKAVDKLNLDNVTAVRPEGVDSKMEGAVVSDFTDGLRKKFVDGDMDLVEVVYMHFISTGRQRPQTDQLFPVVADKLLDRSGESSVDMNKPYIFEPNPNSIFNQVLPMYVQSLMQQITIENRASEQAARIMAMQSANDNAKKLLESLHLEYNKLRQQSITTELLDILGGQTER